MKLVRGIVAGVMVAALGAGLVACGPIGALHSRPVEVGGESEASLEGSVGFSIPFGGGKGDVNVSFAREPLPADRPAPPGVVLVGDMIKLDIEGEVVRGRISIDYGELPAGVRPELLNIYAWSTELGDWVALSGSVTDAVERAVWADTVLLDSFALGTWQVASGAAGDTITTGTGMTLPIKPDTVRHYWLYTRAAAVSSLASTLEHLTGAPETMACDPKAANVTVSAVSSPAGRVDACVLTEAGKQLVRVRNRFPFPMVLQLPKDGRVRPVVDTTAAAGAPDTFDGIRNTVLTYLNGSVAVGGGQTVTLEVQPGTGGPVQLTGRLDWSAIALDSGLRQLELLVPTSGALRPATAEALIQAHGEFGAAAVKDLARGEVGTPAVQALLQKAGLSESAHSVGDVFEYSSCVLERLPTVAGADRDVLGGVKTAGPTVTLVVTDCLNAILDRYLPAGNGASGSLLDVLKTTTATVHEAIPKADRKTPAGPVTVTVTAR
ncbi:hypothetical protein QLQ12_01860 [Actinoplanes sp. NEAU-A12]|uniref:GerMN domain-containing protein n=1 Tax=Actinoplanes sandaracinus TaxID=3045177 RepID=A0ABT6WC96_9ACTN|nr:hypothetical protein [Actinoplanes sandaracinus]MDI6097346.1 hypothetical protein [Actinoplanes sandaracinus]